MENSDIRPLNIYFFEHFLIVSIFFIEIWLYACCVGDRFGSYKKSIKFQCGLVTGFECIAITFGWFLWSKEFLFLA
jgi:hypothetical protein